MNRRLATAVLALGLAGGVGGCSISSDGAPRDITGDARRELLASPNAAGASSGLARIYLVVPAPPGGSSSLRAVPRDVERTPTAVLTALFDGPNAGEQRQLLSSAVPSGTLLNSARLASGVLRVDIDGPMADLTGEPLIDAVAQVVLTATEVAGIDSVQLLVGGSLLAWPDGSGELQSDPLTRYDFPGLVESSQPDYPEIPAPTTPPTA